VLECLSIARRQVVVPLLDFLSVSHGQLPGGVAVDGGPATHLPFAQQCQQFHIVLVLRYYVIIYQVLSLIERRHHDLLQ
jgi:hypothetical protein